MFVLCQVEGPLSIYVQNTLFAERQTVRFTLIRDIVFVGRGAAF